MPVKVWPTGKVAKFIEIVQQVSAVKELLQVYSLNFTPARMYPSKIEISDSVELILE